MASWESRYAIRLDTLRLRSSRSTVAGRLVLPRDFRDPRVADKLEVSLRARPFALADVARFVPAVVPEGDLRLEIVASSEGRIATGTLPAELNSAMLRLEAGTLLGSGAPALYQVSGHMRGVDPAELVRAAAEGSLTGEIDADIRGERVRSAHGV